MLTQVSHTQLLNDLCKKKKLPLNTFHTKISPTFNPWGFYEAFHGKPIYLIIDEH